MAVEAFGSALAVILAHPALGHALVALGLMAGTVPSLRALRCPHAGWFAATAVSLLFYGREAEEAERFLKPAHGDPAAFFLSLWPGCWTGGGADFGEWLAPTLAAGAFAWLVSRRRSSGREVSLQARPLG